MSELGSKKGQSENKNAPVFDSSELETKQKTDHFVNVKDAEARKKEAERKAKEVEKKAENEHKEAVKEAAKKADKEAQSARKGKRLIIWVAVIVIICILAFGIFALIKWGRAEKTVKSDEAAQEYALDIYRDINKIQATESLSAAREKMESVIDGATPEQKVYLSMYYAEFLASKTGDEILAREWLEKAESFCKNEKESADVRSEYANIAMIVGNEDFDIYRNSEGGRDEE